MAIGVPRPLAIEKPQAVDLVQAARYFGAHGEPDAATLALLQKCAVPLLAAAMPRAVWLLADHSAGGDAGPRGGCPDPPGRCWRYRRRGSLRCLGQRTG